jgi:hypothetical protein
MKEKEYHIKIHSLSRFFVAFMVVFLTSLSLEGNYFPEIEYKFISIILFLAIMVMSIYLAHLIGMAKIKVKFTDAGIVHIWERRFLFSWEKDIEIPWSIIDTYVFDEERTFDTFTINFKTKWKYKIVRLNFLPLNDDFKKFEKDFPRFSNEYRNKVVSANDIDKIVEGKSMYADKSFRWVFYLLSAGFLVLLLTKIFNPESGTTWSVLGAIGCSLLYYGAILWSND